MPWAQNTDTEERLRLEIKALLVTQKLSVALPRERTGPGTQIRILEAQETRVAIVHIDKETGKKCNWQNWEVTLDVVGDGRTVPGQLSKASSGLSKVFGADNWPERNQHGIYTATLRKTRDAFSEEGELKKPYTLTCDTFTFIE